MKKSGSTLIELLIYMVVVLLFFSIILPNSRKWMERGISISEVNRVKNSIRYARFLSFLKDGKVEVRIFPKDVKIVSNREIIKESSLNFVRIVGNRYLAFSKGVPYISGTLRFFLGTSFVAEIRVTPVVGKINLAWKW